jgi:hypothetical protein
MSNTRSDSSEDISIYETPINSPSNESLIDSTRMDSSLFGNTSVNTQSIDLPDFQESLESIPNSAATESTLRQTVERLNSGCLDRNPYISLSSDIRPESSVWFSGQVMSGEKRELNSMLNKYMSQLECEQLELLGVEQQIHSLSLKCRSIRENMLSKTNAIHSIINEMVSTNKQMFEKQTQTDFDYIKPVVPLLHQTTSSDPNQCFSSISRKETIVVNPNVSVSQPKASIQSKISSDNSNVSLPLI